MNAELVPVRNHLKADLPYIEVRIFYKENTIITHASGYYFDIDREAIDLFNDYGIRFHTINMVDPDFQKVNIIVTDQYNKQYTHTYLKKPNWES